jgi:ADP-L-glycero-D-manno-heptose 6-epimerase
MLFVTGGAGFIGTNFVRFLNERAIDKIVIIDELGSNGKWTNLRGAQFKDIISPEVFKDNLSSLVKSGDSIVHLGACSSTTETDADYLWKNNVQYSQMLIDFCVSRGNKIIYASSASVYGMGENGFNDVEGLRYNLNLKPMNPYGFSKLKVDEFVLRNEFDKKVVGLRFFNVWGNYERHKDDQASLISKITPQLLNEEKITLFKHPSETLERDFIWVGDVCKVMSQFLINDKPGIYNVGTGQPQTWETMVNSLAQELQVKPKIKYCSIPMELVPHYQVKTKANIAKLKKAINFEPTSLETALKNYVMRYHNGQN